jgi:Pyruvate/2-oxoacid:ferredoxin oxidoreductase delta subunit
MNKHETLIRRPPLETLACINAQCELYGQRGQKNLTVRKTYGKDRIRYLRCQGCGAEFRERKGTALWRRRCRKAKQ